MGALTDKAPLLLVLAGVLAFSINLRGPFVFDDNMAITHNPALGDFAAVINPPGHTPIAGRPIVALSLHLNYQLTGLNPLSYRAPSTSPSTSPPPCCSSV